MTTILVARLIQYNGVEHALFDLLSKRVSEIAGVELRNPTTNSSGVIKEDYQVYAPSGVNYMVDPEKNELGVPLVRLFENENGYHHIACGKLELKRPEKLAKDIVTYFHLPDDDIFVAYEKLTDDGPTLRVDQLHRKSEGKGQYTRLAQIDLPYLYDFSEGGEGPFFLTDGRLQGTIQYNHFENKGSRIMHRQALDNVVTTILSDDLYHNPVK